MRRHAVEALGVAGAALFLTMMIAAPVVRAPSDLIFGQDIVGRHHDPFTVMRQFERPMSPGWYSQPVTDLTGAAISRVAGPVAAYNWLVLLSFPLSAAAAYLLARHLTLQPSPALLAALLFAFSPFHLAHAAYHPHVAQTQWLPLYLLALWRCLDDARPTAVAGLAGAALLVTLSNFYGGLIAAVMTPIAVGGYWFARARFIPGARRQLGVTAAALVGIALAGLALAWWAVPEVVSAPAAFAFARGDLFRYSARWWSYLVPPVTHPLLGAFARRLWTARGVDVGVLEQQVSLGWSVVALGLIGIYGWASDRLTGNPRLTATATVPALATMALVALFCSLTPQQTILGVTIVRPSGLLYSVLPMFRAYARFGVIVQLMAALLAATGAAWLRKIGTLRARSLCGALVILAVAEYAVWPPTESRDVLPTAAHRWVMRQPAGLHVFDCEPMTLESASVPWLTDGRIALASGAPSDCAEPQLSARLSASGFTHLLVRDTWERQWLRNHGSEEDVRVVARFPDADVFSLAPAGQVYTADIAGFWPREHSDNETWRWMGTDALWTIVTPTTRPRVTLEIQLHAFHGARRLSVGVDGNHADTLAVDESDRIYRIGPLALSAGIHQLAFHSDPPATQVSEVVASDDRRSLAFAVGDWKWSGQ